VKAERSPLTPASLKYFLFVQSRYAGCGKKAAINHAATIQDSVPRDSVDALGFFLPRIIIDFQHHNLQIPAAIIALDPFKHRSHRTIEFQNDSVARLRSVCIAFWCNFDCLTHFSSPIPTPC
jgi:hypothetical protein